MRVHTIGHSTRSLAEFIGLLGDAGVELLVDVRSYPASRHNPQFNREALAAALAGAGIEYRHLRALGGRRGPQALAMPSPNGYWRVAGFRNYADYALTPAFRAGLDELLALARERSSAVMCAEAPWWRCHRQIVADYLLVAGVEVRHILGAGEVETAGLTAGAVPRADGSVHYPPAQASLL